MNCPTLRIKSTNPEQGEFVVINASDFDPVTMTLFEIPPPPPAPDAPPPVLPPPDALAKLGANWRDGDVAEMRAIAAAISGRAVDNKDQAVAVIEAALKAKG